MEDMKIDSISKSESVPQQDHTALTQLYRRHFV